MVARLLSAFGDLKHNCGLAPLHARGIERVALHADLVMLARLGQALLTVGTEKREGRGMNLLETVRFEMQSSNPTQRLLGGSASASSSLDSEIRLRTIENAMAALAGGLDTLAQGVDEMQSGMRVG